MESTMPNTTLRPNARTLPEATDRAPQPPQTAEELQALASDFEAAFQAQRPFFYGSGTDEEADAATARVDETAYPYGVRLWEEDTGNTLEIRLCKSLDDAIYSARGAMCSQRAKRALFGKWRAA
jgi:hypothetical protein